MRFERKINKKKKYMTFVGSRKTPKQCIEQGIQLANKCVAQGYILRSGNAQGFDQIVSSLPVASREIYLPYTGFGEPCGYGKTTYTIQESHPQYQKALQLVYQFHPLGNRLNPLQLRYLVRDVFQVLGQDLQTPSEAVVCWTPDGAQKGKDCTHLTGGTAMAIRIADAYGIPVQNLNAKTEKTYVPKKVYLDKLDEISDCELETFFTKLKSNTREE